MGGKVTECLREESVMQIFELSRQVSNERHFFREFLRFTRIEPGIYVAHMEPKGNVVALVAGHFADRMPSEDWMIIDDRRGLGVIHPKNEPFYVTKFREEEMERLCQTEQQEDLYTQMWKEFFLHDCSGEKGESGLPEKYVSVTIQKTCDGVFIKREEGIQRLLTVLFEKQTENWYDKKKRAESYIVSNRK